MAKELSHPNDLGLVLVALPGPVLGRVVELADCFQAGQMVSNRPAVGPTVGQVEVAKRWIEATVVAEA